jgi:hypothetical protein
MGSLKKIIWGSAYASPNMNFFQGPHIFPYYPSKCLITNNTWRFCTVTYICQYLQIFYCDLYLTILHLYLEILLCDLYLTIPGLWPVFDNTCTLTYIWQYLYCDLYLPIPVLWPTFDNTWRFWTVFCWSWRLRISVCSSSNFLRSNSISLASCLSADRISSNFKGKKSRVNCY